METDLGTANKHSSEKILNKYSISTNELCKNKSPFLVIFIYRTSDVNITPSVASFLLGFVNFVEPFEKSTAPIYQYSQVNISNESTKSQTCCLTQSLCLAYVGSAYEPSAHQTRRISTSSLLLDGMLVHHPSKFSSPVSIYTFGPGCSKPD